MVVVAASAPPLETPTSAGSASGLRNRPCMMAPATASSAPTMLASAMRGSRIDHSTSRSRAIRSGSPAPDPSRGQQAMQRDAGGPDGGGRDGDDDERCQQRADHDHRGAAHPAHPLAGSLTAGVSAAVIPGRPARRRSRSPRETRLLSATDRAPTRVARRQRGARTEAKEIEPVHGDEGISLGRRRQREGRMREHRAGVERIGHRAASRARPPAAPR